MKKLKDLQFGLNTIPVRIIDIQRQAIAGHRFIDVRITDGEEEVTAVMWDRDVRDMWLCCRNTPIVDASIIYTGSSQMEIRYFRENPNYNLADFPVPDKVKKGLNEYVKN